MKTSRILNQTDHRPFECPTRPWVFYQEWNKAIFLHWEVKADAIQRLLPSGLKVDVINGKAWMSLVAFDMNNIKARYLPKLPRISDFQEINIRTYVICNGKPSVYFLSMEANNKVSCKLLEKVSKFPYRYSEMKRDDDGYQSKNSNLGESFSIDYELDDEPVVKDETDFWLTERYAVFQDHKNEIIEYDVHHLEWPMRNITSKFIKVNYPRFHKLINDNPDRIHYSKGVQVLTWNKRKHQIKNDLK